MKKIIKYLILTGLNAVLYLFMVMPANAQHGGGGGHFGGGGGHFGGGDSHFAGGHIGGGDSHFAGGGHFDGGGHSISRQHFGSDPHFSVHGAYGHNFYGHGGRGGYVWDRHGDYFYNRGYYGSLYYPMLGLDFGFLPYGYYSFNWDNNNYYFSDGFYYQYNNDQYTVVEPPVGAAIKKLPKKAKSVTINGQQYYEQNGVYYSAITKDDGTLCYQIAGKDGVLNTDTTKAKVMVPKVGAIITKLPPDCKKIKLNDETFFVSQDGIYYEETKNKSNQKVYKIVGLES